MWCIPNVTSEFLVNMNDVLELYEKPFNKQEPVLCFDEKSKELHGTTRETRYGKITKQDYEYKRNGVVNIFMTVEPLSGFRTVAVTDTRKRLDFAQEIKRIVRLPRYRKVKKIHIVLDNLNTHNEKSLQENLSDSWCKKIMSKIEFHHTPKHASWLNMAEVELSIMSGQCTNKRIKDKESLMNEVQTWEEKRNTKKSTITWRFTKDDAKRVFKLGQN